MKLRLGILATALLVASCASGPPMIDQMQPEAIAMAQRRGAFEMNCPAATAQMLSRESVQPLVNTFAYSGPVRDEYTVGVTGCGQRTSYVVICPESGGNGCFAGGSRTEIQR
jgi:hypothetical protein